MSKELPFIVYCVEEYKRRKGMTGREVMELFGRYAVCEYICACYDALHVEGVNSIMGDIEQYIASRQTA